MTIMLIFVTQFFFFWLDERIILNHFKLQKIDLVYFFILVPLASVIGRFDQILGVLAAQIVNFIFVYFLTKNIRTSIVTMSIVFMIGISTDHIDSFINLNSGDYVFISLYIAIQIIICLILYFSMRLTKNKVGINEFNYSNFEVAFSFISMLVCLYLVIFEEIKQGNQLIMLLYNMIVVLLMISVLLVSHFSRLQTLKDKYVIQAKEARIKSNNQYIHEIERHYNELRTFRHNYQNVLLSLDEYLKTNDIKGLKTYYNKSIKPISNKLNQKRYKLEDLSKVDNKEIKSILFNKLYSAQLLDIDVSFESKSEITKFDTDTLDLTLALGIILDNAIDETKEQKHGQIQVGIMYDGEEINFIVQNTLRQNDVPIWKMKQLGFSTKGTNRGVGLSNLEEIMNRNRNMMLETMKLDNYFLQKITIEVVGEKNHD